MKFRLKAVGPAGTLGTGASPSTPPSFGVRSQGQPDITKLKTCDTIPMASSFMRTKDYNEHWPDGVEIDLQPLRKIVDCWWLSRWSSKLCG